MSGAGAGGSEAGGAALIVPGGLTVVAKPGGCGELVLTGLTLRQGSSGAELYVALKNGSDRPACSPAFSVELLDRSEQPVATGLGGLLVKSFYRLDDGSGNIAACVAPGELAMAAITDLPAELVVEQVARLVYFCNFWQLEGAALPGLDIVDVRAVTSDDGVVFTGALVNGFDVALESPGVAIFPLGHGGRPLAVTRSRAASELPPSGRWQFETSVVTEPFASHAAYPTHGP
jgi:hypothetical protein